MKKEMLKAMLLIINSRINTDTMKESIKTEIYESELIVTFFPNELGSFNFIEILSCVDSPFSHYATIDKNNLVFHIFSY